MKVALDRVADCSDIAGSGCRDDTVAPFDALNGMVLLRDFANGSVVSRESLLFLLCFLDEQSLQEIAKSIVLNDEL